MVNKARELVGVNEGLGLGLRAEMRGLDGQKEDTGPVQRFATRAKNPSFGPYLEKSGQCGLRSRIGRPSFGEPGLREDA